MASTALSQEIPTSRIASPKTSRPPSQPLNAAKHSLALAFRMFAPAADSLEKSYGRPQVEIRRLRSELEGKNRDLATSVDENVRVRRYQARLLHSLPCGVLVVPGDFARGNSLNDSGAFDGNRAMKAAARLRDRSKLKSRESLFREHRLE
jgi:hypothetical protein